VATSPAPLEGPPGGGLRFVVVARLAGTELVRFKVDISAGDVVVGELESCFSDSVLERLGFGRCRFPVYPINQHVAEKLHALTLPRDVENTRPRRSISLVHPRLHVPIGALAVACAATFDQLSLADPNPAAAASFVRDFLRPVYLGVPGLAWDPVRQAWTAGAPIGQGARSRRGGSRHELLTH
jgi:hypothetical protein